MIDFSKCVKEHTSLSVCILGLPVLGYLGYHAVRWIINKCHKTEKIDRLAQKKIDIPLKRNLPGSNKNDSVPQKGSLSDVSSVKQEAATKIQSVCRGHLARCAFRKEKRILLSDSLFERAKPFIDTPGGYEDLPRAGSGITRVYFPPDLPIVLKESGPFSCKRRLKKMKEAMEICHNSGYQHLVIPTARTHGKFIIESRLPIMKNNDTREQIGLYLENIEKFTKAVEEFTGFLCQGLLDDITGGTNDAYAKLCRVPIGRYDNVAMYLEEGVGKLGLIDLERFYPRSRSEEKRAFSACERAEGAFSACQQAIRLFPHHLDTIINAAKKFNPNIEKHREKLEEERNHVLEYFQKAYKNHLDFVKEKNIDLKNPIKFNEISQSRKEEIREVIEGLIQEQTERPSRENCLGENPDVTMKRFNEVAFPEIFDCTLKFIDDQLKKKLESLGGSAAISSYPKLVSARTLEFSYGSKAYEDLKELIASKLDMITLEQWGKVSLASQIIDVILEELEKGKEIAHYNPSFGDGIRSKHLIFC